MAKKKAALQVVNGDNSPSGREEIWRVRGGEKGTGQQYGPNIIVWPWSASSAEQAENIVREIARNNDLQLTETEPDW